MIKYIINFIELIMFLGWIIWISLWIKKGCKIPQWLHYIAVIAGILAILSAILLYIQTNYFSFSLFLFPTPLVYLIWLWLFGPDITKKDDTH